MRVGGWVLGFCVSFAAAEVAAQGAPSQASLLTAGQRRATLQRAVLASERGDHRGALSLAEGVARAGVTPSLQLFMAEEWEALAAGGSLAPDEAARRLAEAAGLATQCLRGATATPRLRRRARILADCTALLQRTNPRVARVRLSLARSAPEGLEVSVNGRALTAAEREGFVPVAPGRVVVMAAASGHRGFSRELRVLAGEVGEVEIALSPVDPVLPPAVSAQSGADDAPVQVRRAASPPTRGPTPPTGERRTAAGPWVLIGVGAAAGVTAALFFTLQSAANGRREGYCPRADGVDRCRDVAALALGQAAYEDERLWRDAGVVALVAGGALVGAGVLWHVLAPRRAPTVAVVPWWRGVGITLGGTL